MPGLLSCCVVLSVGRFSLQARPIIGWWNNKSTPNFIFFSFFSTFGKSASLPLSVGFGALVGGRDLRAFIEAFWTCGRMCGRADYLTFSRSERSERAVECRGRGVFMGELPNVQNVQNVRSKFFEKNAFFVLTSEKYGVIYPAGKNNKKKYNHYVCYIRTDDSDTN